MRIMGVAILASSLIVSGALAATNSAAPLAPGKPAGLKKAQSIGNGKLIGLGIAVLGGGAALVASGGGTVSSTAAGAAP